MTTLFWATANHHVMYHVVEISIGTTLLYLLLKHAISTSFVKEVPFHVMLETRICLQRWTLFFIFSRDMLTKILEATNKRTVSIDPGFTLLTLDEMHGFLGILLFAGVHRDNRLPVHSLFHNEHRRPIYSATIYVAKLVCRNFTLFITFWWFSYSRWVPSQR